MSEKPWADPNSPGNTIRPDVKCIGCGKMGCITAWGPWCFECNVPRMKRLDKGFSDLAESIGMKRFDDHPHPIRRAGESGDDTQ